VKSETKEASYSSGSTEFAGHRTNIGCNGVGKKAVIAVTRYIIIIIGGGGGGIVVIVIVVVVVVVVVIVVNCLLL
jgi:uncharacterized membrane protein